MYIHMYMYIHIYMHRHIWTYMCICITLHCFTFRYIPLHYITLHYITLNYSTVQYITVQYVIVHCIYVVQINPIEGREVLGKPSSSSTPKASGTATGTSRKILSGELRGWMLDVRLEPFLYRSRIIMVAIILIVRTTMTM